MDTVIALIIHLLVPAIGIGLYLWLLSKMSDENITNPLIIELFIVFATYGGLLIVILTSLFWEWSGLASLGTFYLIIGGPIAMGLIAYLNYKRRKESKYHKWTFLSGLLYFIVAPLSFAILFLIDKLV